MEIDSYNYKLSTVTCITDGMNEVHRGIHFIMK